MTLYCVDDRHGTPCPDPCPACAEEGCDPRRVEAESQVEAARAEGWSEEYIATEVAAGRMS